MDSPLACLPLSTTLLYILYTAHYLLHPSKPHSPKLKTKALSPKPLSSKLLNQNLSLTLTLTPALLLTLTLPPTIHLLHNPQRIIQRGTPNFSDLTPYTPEADILWQEFLTRYDLWVEEFHRIEPILFRFARVQRVCYFWGGVSVLVAFGLEVAFLLRGDRCLGRGKAKGGGGGGGGGGILGLGSGVASKDHDVDEERGRRRMRKSTLSFVFIAGILILAGSLCRVNQADAAFVECVESMAGGKGGVGDEGWWPEMLVEWSSCYGGDVGGGMWFCAGCD